MSHRFLRETEIWGLLPGLNVASTSCPLSKGNKQALSEVGIFFFKNPTFLSPKQWPYCIYFRWRRQPADSLTGECQGQKQQVIEKSPGLSGATKISRFWTQISWDPAPCPASPSPAQPQANHFISPSCEVRIRSALFTQACLTLLCRLQALQGASSLSSHVCRTAIFWNNQPMHHMNLWAPKMWERGIWKHNRASVLLFCDACSLWMQNQLLTCTMLRATAPAVTNLRSLRQAAAKFRSSLPCFSWSFHR